MGGGGKRRFRSKCSARGQGKGPDQRGFGRARHTRAVCLVRDARTLRRRRSGLTASTASWSSSIMLGTGWALIDACIGNSRPHSHVAHQISLAVERDLEISGDVDMIVPAGHAVAIRSEEHTSELQSLMRHSYAVHCLKKKQN